MNGPERKREAWLAALLLAGVAALAFLTARSRMAAHLRSGAPLSCLLTLRPNALQAQIYALLYLPARSELSLLYVASGNKGIEEWILALPEPRFGLSIDVPGDAPSPRRLRARLADASRDLRFWGRLSALLGRLDGAFPLRAFDRLLLVLEAYRTSPRAIRLHWLGSPDDVPETVRRILGPEDEPGGLLQVELLNASGRQGLALAATKALRAQGLDVVAFGNAPTEEETTLLIDRGAWPARAERAARAIGCPDAEVLARPDPRAAAPVAIVFGRDFKRCKKISP